MMYLLITNNINRSVQAKQEMYNYIITIDIHTVSTTVIL